MKDHREFEAQLVEFNKGFIFPIRSRWSENACRS